MTAGLFDAVYGCLIGGAIGDALGAPVEGWYWTDIRREHGKVTEFMPFQTGYSDGRPGTVTDDTVYRHYLCLAIVEKGGRITPDELARVLLERMNPDRLWVNERIVLQKLRTGMSPYEAGRGQPPAGCSVMGIAPVGIINAADPDQAFQDGRDIAALNQDGLDRDAAGTVAAGVAAAFCPGATVEGVLDAMRGHCTYVLRRGIELTMDLVEQSQGVDDFAQRYYATMLDWTWPSRSWDKERFFSASSLEIVTIVMALLRLCGPDPERCMVEAASFGRDCDTTANLIGSITGALGGASAIRADWIETVETANAPFFQELEGDPAAGFRRMAERMVGALRAEQGRARRRAELLARLLG